MITLMRSLRRGLFFFTLLRKNLYTVHTVRDLIFVPGFGKV